MTTEIVMLIIGVLIAEGTEVAPWLARRLVRWSARVRYTDAVRAQMRAEELAAVIDSRPGKLFKLATALCFVSVASGARISRLVSGRFIAGRWSQKITRTKVTTITESDLRRLSPEVMRRREELHHKLAEVNITVLDHSASFSDRERARAHRGMLERELIELEGRVPPTR